MTKAKKMAALLSKKLSVDELTTLFIVIDEDPPGGPFWDALGEQVKKVNPSLFGTSHSDQKEEP